MKELIKQILKEETEKSSNDLFEIIVKQDIINSDTRRIDRKAIDKLINKLVMIVMKCTNNQDGEFIYQVRNIKHGTFNTDVVYHRLMFIGVELERYVRCIEDWVFRYALKNHDTSEVTFKSNLSKKEIIDLLKKAPKNSTYRNTWTKESFFEFYHPEMVSLTNEPFIKFRVGN
jgi:dGTP triphosphohydrolase